MRAFLLLLLLLIAMGSVTAQGCPRGFLGQSCEINKGCFQSNCDNNGFCQQNGYCFCAAGFEGNFCENKIPRPSPLSSQTRAYEAVIYGPGVPLVTVGEWQICGRDYICNLYDPAATCSADKLSCQCADPCTTGRHCTERRSTYVYEGRSSIVGGMRCDAVDNSAVAYALSQGYQFLQLPPGPCSLFGPNGCPSNGSCMRRQKDATYKARNYFGDEIMVKGTDVCCLRGHDGQSCEIFTGCADQGLNRCDNGGTCSILKTQPYSYRMCACPPGFAGIFCEEVTNPPRPCLMSGWTVSSPGCSVICGTGTAIETRQVVTWPDYPYEACPQDVVREVPCTMPVCWSDLPVRNISCAQAAFNRDTCMLADMDRVTNPIGCRYNYNNENWINEQWVAEGCIAGSCSSAGACQLNGEALLSPSKFYCRLDPVSKATCIEGIDCTTYVSPEGCNTALMTKYCAPSTSGSYYCQTKSRDCTVSAWTRSPKSMCTKPCGGGIILETREILQVNLIEGAICPTLFRTVPCNTDTCVRCQTTNWTNSSNCTLACGGGTLSQTSTVAIIGEDGVPCPLFEQHNVTCNTHDCVTCNKPQDYKRGVCQCNGPNMTLNAFGTCVCAMPTSYGPYCNQTCIQCIDGIGSNSADGCDLGFIGKGCICPPRKFAVPITTNTSYSKCEFPNGYTITPVSYTHLTLPTT